MCIGTFYEQLRIHLNFRETFGLPNGAGKREIRGELTSWTGLRGDEISIRKRYEYTTQ